MGHDTVRLLRECDAGVQMGIASIDDVLSSVSEKKLEERLERCKEEHVKLQREIARQLTDFGDSGKSPSIIAKGMSHIKTGVKLSMHKSDETVADLMTDGCNMGVKSLGRYLNEYKAASQASKDIAKRLIALEQELAADIRQYL